MGQKINPIGFRIGVNKTWTSRWYANANYAKNLLEDIKVREFLKKKMRHAGVSKIEIERLAKSVPEASCARVGAGPNASTQSRCELT